MLAQELRRESLGPLVPIAFLVDDVKRTSLSLAVCRNILFLMNARPERVVGIILHRFQSIMQACVFRLIGVESDVHAFRKVVRIYGHTLKIVCSVNTYTNLRVSGLAKIDVGNASTELDYSVLEMPTRLGVVDLKPR